MCIIPWPIQSVDQTRIFVMPNREKTRQMTFYKNSVETSDENMMILPVPNIQTLDLHTISYKTLFDNLRSSVSKIESRPFNHYADLNMLRCAASIEPLPIIEHGSYLVSVAPTLDDLFRLNRSVFELPQGIHSFFVEHYSREFGYLCCKLKEGAHNYEPLCYSHDLHSNGRLFVPTLHYHNHNGRIDTEHADWDHLIYSVGTTNHANHDFTSHSINKVRWKRFPEEWRHGPEVPVRCASIEGNQANRDIAFEIV